MQTITVNEHKIVLYKGADEMPIKRYSKFQKYNVFESGVGSNINAIGAHFGKLFELLNFSMTKDALQEAKNLYYSYYVILEEINIPGMAFACLIYSIDDVPLTDLSEDNLKDVVERLSEIGVTAGAVISMNEEVKKKVHNELKLYAPDIFNDETTTEFYTKIKAKILALAEYVKTNRNASLIELDRYFAEFVRPQNFDSDNSDNAILKAELTFENLCAILESNGVSNPAELSVMQFYLRLEYFKKLHKSMKPGGDKGSDSSVK